MIKFGLAVSVWIEEAIINDLVAVKFGVVVKQIDNADAFYHTLYVTAVLAADAFDLEGIRVVNHGVVEDQVSLRGLNERFCGLLAQESRSECFGFQIAIDAVMV